MTLEFLSSRNWTTSPTVSTPIDHLPKYEKLAERVKEFADRGATINCIAAALGQDWRTINDALQFARTGVRPTTKPSGRPTGKGHQYRCIDPVEVVRLRDVCKMSFKTIAGQLGVSRVRVAKAYDQGNPKAAIEAAKQGEKLFRGDYHRIDPDLVAKIRTRLEVGASVGDIVRELDCAESTVRRIKVKR